jgi:hypothetical protein
MQVIETRTRLKGRAAYRDRAYMLVIARLPREGRIARQCRRCFTVRAGVATTADLRAFAYPAQPFARWQCWSIKRAMQRLGAKQIGRAGGIGRPAIWAIR